MTAPCPEGDIHAPCIDPAQLVGLAEIAGYYDVRPSAVWNWQQRYADTFPEPVAELKMGRLWILTDVLDWHAARADR